MNCRVFLAMAYQQCRYKDTIRRIPVRNINKQHYMFLQDVHDQFPRVRNFTCKGEPVAFEYNEDHVRIEPAHIRASLREIIDCHKPTQNGEAVLSIPDNQNQQIFLSRILDNTNEIRMDTKYIKRTVDEILNHTFELAEYPMPRLFIVLPEDTPHHYNPAHLFHLKYRLHFLCECEQKDQRHFAFHEGYKIKRPREFFRKYGPYLSDMLTIVKYAITIGSVIIPQLSHVTSQIPNVVVPKEQMFLNNLSARIGRLEQVLSEATKTQNISTNEDVQYVEGVAFREIESFLEKTDECRSFENLYRSRAQDGHIRWLCVQHSPSHYCESIRIDLPKQFESLGGAFQGDVAVVQGEASINFSKICKVFKDGLPVFSIVLKDLHLKEEDFYMLLDHVSHQSIRNLEIKNIIVSRFRVGESDFMKIKKRSIISKLNNIVKVDHKLNIQYTFTKSFKQFTSKLIRAITETNSRLFFQVQSLEATPSLELAGTKETGFTLSINSKAEKDEVSYETAITNIFQLVPNITKIILNSITISDSIWDFFCEFLAPNATLQELTVHCCLTLKQTRLLCSSLMCNRTLKTLHMINVWEEQEELDGFKETFEMLTSNVSLNALTLTCNTDRLQLDLVAESLLRNTSLRVLRLPKCHIDQNTNIRLVEKFFQTTSIHTLSLELINRNDEAPHQRLARAVDKNENLEILELQGSNCSAIFHRHKHIPETEINVVPSTLVQTRKRSSRNKIKKILSSLNCLTGGYRRPHEEIIHYPVVSIQENNRKNVTEEPFYSLCNHPSFYKQIQENTQNLKLEQLQVTIKAHVTMVDLDLKVKSNLTVTQLKIDRRTLIENDIQILVEAFRYNNTITHLHLNDLKLSIDNFHLIFDFLRQDRTLRVLKVSQQLSYSDHNKVRKKIKTLELENPFLKIVYENQ